MAADHQNIDSFFTIYEQFKKNYVAARRSIKKRFIKSKEQVEIYASSETTEEETADDLEEEDISNIFEKLFKYKGQHY